MTSPGWGNARAARGARSLRLKGAAPTAVVALSGACRPSAGGFAAGSPAPPGPPSPRRRPLGTSETRVGRCEARELPVPAARGSRATAAGKGSVPGRGGALPCGQRPPGQRLEVSGSLQRSVEVPPSRPRRAAAPLNPKALSHEEAPCPPPHTLHEAPRPRARDPRPARTRAHGPRGRGCRGVAEAARGPLAAEAGPAAPPRPGGRRAALTSGNAMGPAWPCGTGGRTDRPAGGGPARRGPCRHVGTIFAASRAQRRTRTGL